jgi:hypothetical protein
MDVGNTTVLEYGMATVVLFVGVGVGLVAHELAHRTVLAVLGVPSTVEWFPDRRPGTRGVLGVGRPWATVTIHRIPRHVPTWGLRVAALAPLGLVVPPAVLLSEGSIAATVSGNVVFTAATIAWFGCGIPSPRDFALFWHAERVVPGTDDTGANTQVPRERR